MQRSHQTPWMSQARRVEGNDGRDHESPPTSSAAMTLVQVWS